MAVAGQNTRRPQRGQKIIANQSKPILVIISIKPFTRQSFGQNYFSRQIEWTVFTETAVHVMCSPYSSFLFSYTCERVYISAALCSNYGAITNVLPHYSTYYFIVDVK